MMLIFITFEHPLIPQMKRLILILFFLSTLLDSYFYGQGLKSYRYFFEPLIILTLLLYYLICTKKKNSFILSAFFFIWLGDLLAQHTDKNTDSVGHIGGDDFVVIFQSDDWKLKCEHILKIF